MNYNQYPQQDMTKFFNDYMAKITQQVTGQQTQQSQQSAQVPVFHCQPVKNLQEIEEMKWFNPTPFVGLTEDGQYVGIRRWDGAIPAATTEYFKRIKQEELPQPPRPVTHEELTELIPAVLAQYIPTLLKQMGVSANESSANPSAIVDEQLSAATGGKPKGAMGAKPGEASGNK